MMSSEIDNSSHSNSEILAEIVSENPKNEQNHKKSKPTKMAPIQTHIDITPACMRRRSTFFSNKNTQEPTLKSVKCRLFCRTNYYLNINGKGNIEGVTKRELKEKLTKNKLERERLELEREQEEKRFRVPTLDGQVAIDSKNTPNLNSKNQLNINSNLNQKTNQKSNQRSSQSLNQKSNQSLNQNSNVHSKNSTKFTK